MSEYHVRVHREGDAWLAQVDELAEAHTFASSREQLDSAVREVIALVADLPGGSEPGLVLRWDYSTVELAAR